MTNKTLVISGDALDVSLTDEELFSLGIEFGSVSFGLCAEHDRDLLDVKVQFSLKEDANGEVTSTPSLVVSYDEPDDDDFDIDDYVLAPYPTMPNQEALIIDPLSAYPFLTVTAVLLPL